MENTNTNPENKNTQDAEAPKNNEQPKQQEENKPFYKKGWFWIALGAVAVAAGGVVGWEFFGKKDAPADGATDAAAAA